MKLKGQGIARVAREFFYERYTYTTPIFVNYSQMRNVWIAFCVFDDIDSESYEQSRNDNDWDTHRHPVNDGGKL